MLTRTIDYRLLNNIFLLIGAYFLCHFAYLTFTFLFAWNAGMPETRLYFNMVYYNTFIDGFSWTRSYIIMLYGLPFFSLLVSILLPIIFIASSNKESEQQRVFSYFYILSVLSFIFSEMFLSAIERRSFSIVAEWFYFNVNVVYIMALMALVMVSIVAFYFHIPFMKMANSTKFIKSNKTRVRFLITYLFIPLIVLAVLVFVLMAFTPNYSMNHFIRNEFSRLFFLAMFFAFIVFFNNSKKYIALYKYTNLNKRNITLYIFVSVIVLVSYATFTFS